MRYQTFINKTHTFDGKITQMTTEGKKIKILKEFMSFEPGSNQRPQDGIIQLQSRALPTELSKENKV